jgi:hypothetical protein
MDWIVVWLGLNALFLVLAVLRARLIHGPMKRW